MSRTSVFLQLVLLLLTSTAAFAACVPFHEASRYVGETKCVSGTVLRIKDGPKGLTFFDFCDDYRACPFTVVVFPHDLKNVGDVRGLAGKPVEIHGLVKMYDGRAEIILQRAEQFSGRTGHLPPLPKAYDVERKGWYSAGSFSHPSGRKPAKKRQPARGATEEDIDPMGSDQ
jgi:hypothetical protein